MSENTRIKISINTGEFEFEGTEEFVKSQISNIPEIINKICGVLPPQKQYHPNIQNIQTETRPVGETPSDLVTPPKQDSKDISPLPDNFGEWYNKFPTKLQSLDLVLITGYYQQKISDDNAFETGEVSNLLKEQGIKLSNTSAFAKLLQQSKLVIIVGKRGAKLNRFRISPDGENRIKELLQPTA